MSLHDAAPADSELAVLHFKSYGAGLRGAHHLLKDAQVEILELIPVSDGLVALLLAPSLRSQIEGLVDESLQEWRVFANAKSLRALYSLDNATIQSHLLVLESSRVGGIFHEAERALAQGLGVIEFKLGRGTRSQHLLCLTSDDLEKLAHFSRTCETELHCNLIPDVDPRVKSYFDITPAKV